MKVEIGDFVEYIITARYKVHYAVVTHIEQKPYGMGEAYTVVDRTNDVDTFDSSKLLADFGMIRSRPHAWGEGQQEDYDRLYAPYRRLYDQLRTRLWLSHNQAMEHILRRRFEAV